MAAGRGDSPTSKKEGKKNKRERGHSIHTVNYSGAAQPVCSCSSLTEEAPALISVFIFPWSSSNCISI